MDDSVKERLSAQSIDIMTRLGNSWEIPDEDLARLAGTTPIGFLMRRNGYESRPFPDDVIHRIAILGNIDRTLTKSRIDGNLWMTHTRDEDPFNGRTPFDVLHDMTNDQLTEFNSQFAASARTVTPFRNRGHGLAMSA